MQIAKHTNETLWKVLAFILLKALSLKWHYGVGDTCIDTDLIVSGDLWHIHPSYCDCRSVCSPTSTQAQRIQGVAFSCFCFHLWSTWFPSSSNNFVPQPDNVQIRILGGLWEKVHAHSRLNLLGMGLILSIGEVEVMWILIASVSEDIWSAL